jgi:phospholipase/carboxylesterase
MKKSEQAIEIETGPSPDATVIWLHGLGADGNDFVPVVPALGLPKRLAVRFIFPHAPVRPITLNMGMPMRAWFDIVSLGGVNEDDAGIRETQRFVEQIIADEVARGIATQRIVLAGFSQGGAIALHTGLRHQQRLAGIMALSTWLPLAATLAAERAAANADLPVFMAHGLQDQMIGIGRARDSCAVLEYAGYKLEWNEYPMAHEVCMEELTAIGDWLSRIL